jgi:hypothetical protein
MKLFFPKVLSIFLLATAATACLDEDRTIVSAISATPDGLKPAIDAFQTLLGDKNNLSLLPDATDFSDTGFRSINWDAEPLPFEFPGNFFVQIVPRGLTVASEKDSFRVSNPGPEDETIAGDDNKFDSINPEASQEFITFTPPRLFTVLSDTSFLITFSKPGDGFGEGMPPPNQASVNGFGAVFVDVDEEYTTQMTAFDPDGCQIFQEYVLPSDGGLSFLGVAFGEGNNHIKTVVITLGNKAIDDMRGHKLRGSSSSESIGNNHKNDIVVMDDFFYGEPQPL